jgi:hypothetical protein
MVSLHVEKMKKNVIAGVKLQRAIIKLPKIAWPCSIHQYVRLTAYHKEAQETTVDTVARSTAVCGGTNHSAILEIPVRPDRGTHLL